MFSTAQLLADTDLAQAYFDVVFAMVIMLDADGHILFVNSRAYEVLGWTRDELIGKNWIEYVAPRHFQTEYKEKYYKIISGENPSDIKYEAIVVTKSGQERIISWKNVLVKDASGKNIGMIVSGKDITESKKYEELLKESADQFQSYIENAPFGIFVCNEQGRYQDVNPKAAAILGFTREELLRMSIPEILPVESQEYGLRLFQKVTEEGRATGEFAYKTKDGHIGRWLLEAVRLSPKKFMAFVVDTTERNRLEQQLKNEREDQQIILDSIPAWIFYKDKENRFLRVNKAFCDVMGKSKELLEGVSLFDIFPKEQAEAYWKDDLEVIASKKPKINIIESMTSAKGTLWVQTDKIPFRDKDGIIKGIIGFSVDITVRKETEEKLKMYAQDLEKMNKLMIGRELKMVELKKENAQLSQKA